MSIDDKVREFDGNKNTSFYRRIIKDIEYLEYNGLTSRAARFRNLVKNKVREFEAKKSRKKLKEFESKIDDKVVEENEDNTVNVPEEPRILERHLVTLNRSQSRLQLMRIGLKRCIGVFDIKELINKYIITKEAENLVLDWLQKTEYLFENEKDKIREELADKAFEDYRLFAFSKDEKILRMKRKVAKEIKANLDLYKSAVPLWQTNHTVCLKVGEYEESLLPRLELLGIPNHTFVLADREGNYSEVFKYDGAFLGDPIIADNLHGSINYEYMKLLFFRQLGNLNAVSELIGRETRSVRSILKSGENGKLLWR